MKSRSKGQLAHCFLVFLTVFKNGRSKVDGLKFDGQKLDGLKWKVQKIETKCFYFESNPSRTKQ